MREFALAFVLAASRQLSMKAAHEPAHAAAGIRLHASARVGEDGTRVWRICASALFTYTNDRGSWR
eukprot:6209065-Pleurochrysis_carterae.AAC.3